MAEQSIYRHMYKIDLNDHLKRRDAGILATYDSNADRYVVELTQGGTDFDASGYSVFGYFMRPDTVLVNGKTERKTVLIEGKAEGNNVYVDLPANCYVYDGAFTLSVKIVKGEMTKIILLCDGHLAEARTGVIIDPEHVVPSLEEVLAKMAEADAAAENANTAAASAMAAAETANQAAENIDAKVAAANAELVEKVGSLSEEIFLQIVRSGNPIIVENASGSEVISVNSESNVLLSGKNLAIAEDAEYTHKSMGGTLVCKIKDGVITVNGTSSSSSVNFPLISKEFALPAGMIITISANDTALAQHVHFSNRGISSGLTRTFTLSSASLCNAERNYISIPSGTYDNVEIRFQAEIGSVATGFEVANGIIIETGSTTNVNYKCKNTLVAIGAEDIELTVRKPRSEVFVNVKNLGATGDGTTDDTVALQSALTTHRKVYIPSGVYVIDETITIPGNTEIVGDGESTIIKLGDSYSLTPYQWRENYGADNYFYPLLITAEESSNVTIKGVHVIGNTTAEDEHIQTGLCLYHTRFAKVENVHIERVNYFPENSLPRPSGQWRRGWNLSMFYAEDVEVCNSWYEYASYENVRVGDYSKRVHVHDCVIEYGWRTGLQILKGCDGVTVERCTITQDDFDTYDTEACLTLHSAVGEPITNVLIVDCKLNGNLFEPGTGSGQGISFIDGYTNGITIERCRISATGTRNVIGGWGNGLIVKDCVITGDGNGIAFVNSYENADFVAVGNVIECTGIGIFPNGDHLESVCIESNQIVSGNHGMYIDCAAEIPAIICGNKVSSANNTGIMATAKTIIKNGVISNNIVLDGAYGLRGTGIVDTVIYGNNWHATTTGTNVDETKNLVVNNY